MGLISAVLRPGLGKEPLKATASPDPFGVKIEPDGPRKYKAIVTWKPNGPDTPKEGSVVFRSGEESLTVIVRVTDPRTILQAPQPVPAPPAPSAAHHP
jgi:hypothetical protein